MTETNRFDEILGVTLEDSTSGVCYRLDKVLTDRRGDHWFGLQELPETSQDLLYVTLDRYMDLVSYTPFD